MTADPLTPTVQTPPVTVVIADDAESLRTLLVRALQRGGKIEIVAEARNGAEAVELVERLSPQVLLLDLSMPVLDGMAVLGLVADKVRVVVLTGYGESDLGAECRAAGARGFVEKGSPVADIINAILEVATPARGNDE